MSLGTAIETSLGMILGLSRRAPMQSDPFTDNVPHGPDMIFPNKDVEGMIEILDEVRAHALPTPTVA